MISIKFKGWFQCRLATDPDPSDEPRGISGYMKALPGEPDLDRIIRFHNPLVIRSHTPTVGVYVEEIWSGNSQVLKHPLIGGKFDLLDDPKFFGYNAIIEDDGFEPIVPFNISIGESESVLKRNLSDEEPKYPFDEYKLNSILGKGYNSLDGAIVFEASDIFYQSQIYDPIGMLKKRIQNLENDLKNETDKIKVYNIKSRIEFLKTPSAFRYFAARMHWNLVLNGSISNSIPSFTLVNEEPWRMNFWMGGWDPDAQNGFVSGVLLMPGIELKQPT